MTKISQLSDIGANLAAGDEFVIRDVSDASTPNKKVTSSGFIDYVIAQGSVAGFTQIAAGVGPLSRVLASSSGTTGTLTFSTAAATTLIERARIDSSGRLLIGTSTARSNFFNGPDTAGFQLEGTGATNRFSAQIYGNGSATGPYQIFAKHGGTDVGSTTLVSSGDEIGGLSFQGSDGTEFVEGARITAYVDGTPGANDMPGRLVFSTTADGAASPTERLRIDSAGRVLVGTSTANTSGAKLQTSDGLTFPATQVASADANTLDDYEEGTFTPTLSSGFSSGPTSYAYQVGRYTRIGRLVHFQIDIQPTGATADASQWKLAGLPFNVSTIPGGAYIVYQASSNTNALDVFLANTGGATIDIFTSAGAPRSGNAAGVNINARLIIVGSYIA